MLLRENGVRSFTSDDFTVEFTDRAFVEKPIAEYVNTPTEKAISYNGNDDLRFWSAE